MTATIYSSNGAGKPVSVRHLEDNRRTDTAWTPKGQYNFAIYDAGEIMDACPASPVASAPTIVCWYPGKPTLVCGFTTLRDTVDCLVSTLDAYEAPLLASIRAQTDIDRGS